jgi:hypothetical protein
MLPMICIYVGGLPRCKKLSKKTYLRPKDGEKEAWRSSNFVKKCGELGTHTLLLSPQETAKVAEQPDDGRKTETQWNMCWPLLQVNEDVIIVAAAAAVERDDANAIVTMLLPPSCSNSFLARVLSLSLSLSPTSQGWQMSATRAKQKRITIQGPNISTANFKTQNDTTTTFSCF